MKENDDENGVEDICGPRWKDYLLSKGTAISPVLLTLKRLTALSD